MHSRAAPRTVGTQPCVASLQGIIVYRGAYFGFYDTGKGVIFKDEAQAGFIARC